MGLREYSYSRWTRGVRTSDTEIDTHGVAFSVVVSANEV